MTVELSPGLPATDLEVMPSVNPYSTWQQQEGLSRITGVYVDDLRQYRLTRGQAAARAARLSTWRALAE